MPERLVLASASAARTRLLTMAGLDFTAEPAQIDEGAVKRAMRHQGAVACALALAAAKAAVVAPRHPDALVLGADQLLVAGDEWFDKPVDLAMARLQLASLRGRSHELVTAACVARGGTRLWQVVTVPRLTMREFSNAFLDRYIAAEGEALLAVVGAYRLEGRGIQLFARVEGDHFAVQGLPLIEFLDFLRTCGALPC